MIDKEGLNVITFTQFKKFLNDTGIVLSKEELQLLFNNLDKQNTGKISIKDFKKNFTEELKTFSMAKINIEADDEEILDKNGNKTPRKLDNINDLEISLSVNRSDSIDEKECDSIQFACIKEPRHEFFSSLKRKQRLMVFGARKMLY
mmetsp:Transcript_32301/g.27259  ORF Transcript_32301/g.27259 Transcript_32301/m.27259 type:complete len:147 (-) Transcript_32301:400-840(-)